MLVIDTETTNGFQNPLVYDVGFAITDNEGKIYEKHSYLIRDIFYNDKLMIKAYYMRKTPLYVKALKERKTTLTDIEKLQQIIHSIMIKYKIKEVYAYNADFDIKALNNTLKYLTGNYFSQFFPCDIKICCIWNMACQVIYTQKKYCKYCLENNQISPKGNLKTSAEVGQRYLTKNNDFKEEHTGLSDVLIEIQIMTRCYKTHKKMEKGINPWCWYLPTKKNKKTLDKLKNL